MDSVGSYMDNVLVERLWRSVKYEEVYLKAYESVAEARAGIEAYLRFYNSERPHQTLDYRTPAQVLGVDHGEQVAHRGDGVRLHNSTSLRSTRAQPRRHRPGRSLSARSSSSTINTTSSVRLGWASIAGMLTSDENTSNTEPCRGDLRRVAGMVLSTATLTMYRSLATGCTRVTEYALSRRCSLFLSGQKLPV